MEEIGKKRLASAAVIAAGLAYFFVGAFPLPKSLVLEPRWARVVSDASATTLATAPAPVASAGIKAKSNEAEDGWLPFRLAGRFGYIDTEGAIILSEPIPYGVALSHSAFIAYDRLPEYLSLRNHEGGESARISEPGYPFFDAGRLFVIRPGQCSVAEIGLDGVVLWSRDFPSIVTAFDASSSVALFGLMDGSLVGVDSAGAEVLAFSPGGSRVAGIYGCVVSPDSTIVAAISGLDRQRIVVLEKRSTAYRVTWHQWLESDFRRPVAMAFTEDGKYLAHELPDGIGIYARQENRESILTASSITGIGLSNPKRNLLFGIEGSGKAKKLLVAIPSGKRVFSAAFDADESSLDRKGDALFLGLSMDNGTASVLRMDFKEE